MITTMTLIPILKDLGDGLRMRRSTIEDSESLADFNSRIHSDEGPDKPDLRIGAWVRDLLTRSHPTFNADDFTLVEDTLSGKIVSSLNLISQIWSYAGIPFGVGRVEVVGTLPEYRRRGLVRKQFEEIHALSLAKGQMVQIITGIPNYYRQFGYEMALDLGGGRIGFESQLPKLKEGESEPFLLRPAVEKDLPFIMELEKHAARRSLVTCMRSEIEWRYELTGMSENNVCRLVFRIIETPEGEAVGMLAHPWYNWNNGGLPLFFYELKPKFSWMSVTPSVSRYLWKTSGEYAETAGKTRQSYTFWLGTSHPSYEVWREKVPQVRDPYAFFMRMVDLGGFIKLIRPVLEERMAESELVVGFSGTLKLNFYRSGLQLKFEKGRLVEVDEPLPASSQDGNAAFPDLTFLQLLFGYRSFDELEQSFADCWAKNEEARVLLQVLFPKKPSLVLPMV